MGLLRLLTFVAVLAIYAEAQSSCPALYKRYSKDHTYCKPKNTQCQITSYFSPSDKEIILKEHNKYRSKIATGQEGGLPQAENMLQMVWDDELASVAQAHASLCVYAHDCGDCRRVQNFGVGQNLAQEKGSGMSSIPPADWAKIVKMWYDEVQYFRADLIEKFVPPPPKPTYGHFTQVIWAETWRVGCGYVAFKTGDNSYEKIFTCNYGPGGNTFSKSVYQQGKQAANCPTNAIANADYPGLCKITDGATPTYKPKRQYLFYCDFQEQDDCTFSEITGLNKWLVYSSLTGNYLSIVLKDGEESSVTFKNIVKPTESSFCVVTTFRKGPNVDGEEDHSKAVQTYTIKSANHASNQNLNGLNGQGFTPFGMSLGWKMPTELKITFMVPAGKPEQFFEVKSVYAYNGRCNMN